MAAAAAGEIGRTIVITEINGRAIYWNGHLCEGNRMIPYYPSTFRVWTRCKQYDVPSRAARSLEPQDEITCEICHQFLQPGMRNEIDIYRAAKLIIDQHGENAADFAVERSEQLFDDREVAGAAVWQQFLVAIVELQRERGEDKALN